MVHKKPSTGCQKCRQRHIKCDESKPACQKCITRGYICPGYRDVGGVIFKDQSESVMARQSRRARLEAGSPVTARVRELDLDAQAIVITFFINAYILFPRQYSMTSRGHFDHLIPLYNRVTASSPLSLAVFATAARCVASHLRLRQDTPWLSGNDLAASHALAQAIDSPEESMRDETLLAVLCLDFGTHLAQAAPSPIHLAGALALVHHRGARNFQSAEAQSLFAATRSNVLLHALWCASDLIESATLSFPDVAIGNATPVVAIQGLLMKVIQHEDATIELLTMLKEDPFGPSLAANVENARRINAQLDTWLQSLPQDWQRTLESMSSPPAEESATLTSVGVPILHIAALLGQWLCAKLTVRKSQFAALQVSASGAKGHQNNMCTISEIILEAQTIVKSFCFLTTYLDKQCGPGPDLPWFHNVTLMNVESEAMPSGARVILINLLRWTIKILREQFPGTDGFVTAAAIIERLQNRLEELLVPSQPSPSFAMAA